MITHRSFGLFLRKTKHDTPLERLENSDENQGRVFSKILNFQFESLNLSDKIGQESGLRPNLVLSIFENPDEKLGNLSSRKYKF